MVPAVLFFRRYVLEISNGIDEPGHVRWQMALCLLAVWVHVLLLYMERD